MILQTPATVCQGKNNPITVFNKSNECDCVFRIIRSQDIAYVTWAMTESQKISHGEVSNKEIIII